MHHVGCMASPELYVVQGARRFTTWGTWLALYPTWYRAPCNLHPAMNHVGKMNSPYIVQNKVCD